MLGKGISVHSDIGKLRTVLVHRPGKEIENLTPDLLERLLFDDIPYLKVAREEHDAFVGKMKANGVEVLYIEKLVTEVLTINPDLRKKFLDQFLKEAKVHVQHYEKLRQYFLSLTVSEMVDEMIAGIETNDLGLKSIDGYPLAIDPLPNLLFQRDTFSSLFNGVCLNRMASVTRNRETLFSFYVLKYHPRFANQVPFYYERHFEHSIEGGDVLVLNQNCVIIGQTERTSIEAIDHLAKTLAAEGKSNLRIIVLQIPSKRAFMHLDTVFTNIDYDKFIVHPLIFENLDQFKIWEIYRGERKLVNKNLIDYLSEIIGKKVKVIRCGGNSPIAAGREQWNDGTNVITLEPGKVISYSRNHVTNKLLREAGIEVIEVPSSELSRGRGGPRCMTMSIWRDKL